jgi:hypothetical protein
MDYSYNSNSYDSITISGIGTSSYNTITLPSISPSTYAYTTGTISGGSLFSANDSATVKICTDGIDIAEGADLKIGNHSLKEFMQKMEQRLAILVPDPAKLEHFEALRKAYEHYKTLEALCEVPKKENKE